MIFQKNDIDFILMALEEFDQWDEWLDLMCAMKIYRRG